MCNLHYEGTTTNMNPKVNVYGVGGMGWDDFAAKKSKWDKHVLTETKQQSPLKNLACKWKPL